MACIAEGKDGLHITGAVWVRMFGPQCSEEQSKELFRLGIASDTLCLLNISGWQRNSVVTGLPGGSTLIKRRFPKELFCLHHAATQGRKGMREINPTIFILDR